MTPTGLTEAAEAFVAARDFCLRHRRDYETALREFTWPRLEHFNWALDYFDAIAAGNDAPALHIVNEDGSEQVRSFSSLSRRSSQVASFLHEQGIRRGDCVLLMLGNEVALWESLLGLMKIGAVVSPATGLLTQEDVNERVDRACMRGVIANSAFLAKFQRVGGHLTRIAVGPAKPVGSRSTAVTLLRQPSNRMAPHALTIRSCSTSRRGPPPNRKWCSTHIRAIPWATCPRCSTRAFNQATVIGTSVHPAGPSTPGAASSHRGMPRPPFSSTTTRAFRRRPSSRHWCAIALRRLCAPPTVWRMLVQEPLADYRVSLREALSAGEPLNPTVIEQVKAAWNVTIRDGYGQTETTALVGNSPGEHPKPGSMGKPMPGMSIVLLDSDGRPSDEGEVCIDLSNQPIGLTRGYFGDERTTSKAIRDGYYHTGDVAVRDDDGYLTFVGRLDDVFKSADYRISPFEIESVLVEHEAVAEAAVVPSLDDIRHAVPKAFVVLAPGHEPTRELAASILAYCANRLAPYKRVRRIEFAELPKTVSGKIRRVQLRELERERRTRGERSPFEFFEQEFAAGEHRGNS